MEMNIRNDNDNNNTSNNNNNLKNTNNFNNYTVNVNRSTYLISIHLPEWYILDECYCYVTQILCKTNKPQHACYATHTYMKHVLLQKIVFIR